MACRGLFWPFYVWPPSGAYGYSLAASLLLDGHYREPALVCFPFIWPQSSYWSTSFSAVSCHVVRVFILGLTDQLNLNSY